LDDRRRDGGTNSTLRTKEQEMHITLNEHDDDDGSVCCAVSVVGELFLTQRLNQDIIIIIISKNGPSFIQKKQEVTDIILGRFR